MDLVDTFFSRGRAIRIVGDAQLTQHVEDFFYPSDAAIDIANAGSQNDSRLPLDATILLFSALAVGAYYQGAADLAEMLFQRSVADLSSFVGKNTYDIAIALYLQQAFVVGTGPTNRAKTIAAQAVVVAQELGLNRFSKQNITLERAWLFVFLYFADMLVRCSTSP